MTTATPATDSQSTAQRLYTLRLTEEQHDDLCRWLGLGLDAHWHSDESNVEWIREVNGDEDADWRIRAMGTVDQFLGGDFDVA
jgi:hypothetical protein